MSAPSPPSRTCSIWSTLATWRPPRVTRPRRGKSGSTYSIPGGASTARTPLAEPIFLIQSDKITADSLELYKLDVKGGHRELQLGGGRRNSKPLHLAVTRLGQGLYRIEVDEELDNGEYALSPMGSSRVFCFQIY